MEHLLRVCLLACLLALVGCTSVNTGEPASAGERATNLPGVQPDGAVLLPNQWFLRPAGRQFVVGDFPVAIAMHPGG
jgi:hypothetical protein